MYAVTDQDFVAFAAAALPVLATDPVPNSVPSTLIQARLDGDAPVEPDGLWIRVHSGQTGTPPVAVALRTPPRSLMLTPMPVPAMEAVCDHLLASGVKLPGVYGPAPISDGFARRWAAATRVTATPGFESRVFRMGEPVPPVGVPGHLRAATRADRELLIRWTNAFGTEAVPHEGLDGTEAIDTRLRHPGRLWTWVDDDRPVSMLWISPPGAGVVRVSAVYTPPQLRGRGYASACVAAVSARTMAEGHTCVLHTDINNRTSNKIYQEIGYRPIMDLRDWTFAGR